MLVVESFLMEHKGGWRAYLSYIVSNMVADDLVKQGVSALATVVMYVVKTENIVFQFMSIFFLSNPLYFICQNAFWCVSEHLNDDDSYWLGNGSMVPGRLQTINWTNDDQDWCHIDSEEQV